jgi:hypothetical protein
LKLKESPTLISPENGIILKSIPIKDFFKFFSKILKSLVKELLVREIDFELSTKTGSIGFFTFSFSLTVNGEKSKKINIPRTINREVVRNNFNQ